MSLHIGRSGLEVITVTPDVWCVRRLSYLTCSYIVRAAGGGAVLVDAGMDSDGSDVQAGLEAAGFALGDVRAVLLTHWHNDHAAGGRAVQESTGAPVYYHADDAPYFTRETAHPGLRGRISDLIPELGPLVLFKGLLGEATPRAVPATAHVADGEALLGGEFEVIATPGHTPGHVCFYWRPGRTLFAGDALAVIGGEVRFMSRPVTPDLVAARASAVECLTRREIDALCPGHREPLTEGVREKCRLFAERAATGVRWPVFG